MHFFFILFVLIWIASVNHALEKDVHRPGIGVVR